MLLPDFEHGDAALVQLQINNLADNLIGSDGPYLVIGQLRHCLDALTQLGYTQLHPVQPDGLNAYGKGFR
ncbi:hypothetical protein D3C73_1604240 [compost metagenome]